MFLQECISSLEHPNYSNIPPKTVSERLLIFKTIYEAAYVCSESYQCNPAWLKAGLLASPFICNTCLSCSVFLLLLFLNNIVIFCILETPDVLSFIVNICGCFCTLRAHCVCKYDDVAANKRKAALLTTSPCQRWSTRLCMNVSISVGCQTHNTFYTFVVWF